MAKHRRRFTKEFKREAVELVTKRDYTVSQAASSLGISRGTLGRWKQECLSGGEGAFPGYGHQSADMEELRRLREENRKLRMEKEILNKAAAFFAKESGEGMSLFTATATSIRCG